MTPTWLAAAALNRFGDSSIWEYFGSSALPVPIPAFPCSTGLCCNITRGGTKAGPKLGADNFPATRRNRFSLPPVSVSRTQKMVSSKSTAGSRLTVSRWLLEKNYLKMTSAEK